MEVIKLFLFLLCNSALSVLSFPGVKGKENKEEFPISFNVNLQLIQNSTFLEMQFTPRENSVEITARLDLELYKDMNKSLFKIVGESTGESKEPTPTKLTIGLDGGRFVDVVVISLLPFEESEDTSVINMELGLLTATDHIQDCYWSKKDGVLVPDTIQSYDLISFDVGNNGSLFSTTFSRPWLTCDPQDFQFTLEPIEIWWMLDMSDSRLTSSGLKVLENLEEENSTLVSEDENTMQRGEKDGAINPATSKRTEKPTIDKNSTVGQGKQDIPEEKEAEVLKSIKDHDFQGPVVLSMEILLQNFTHVNVKGCDAAKLEQIYSCPVGSYQRINEKSKPQYYIAATATTQGKQSSARVPEKECPYSADEAMTRTLVKALRKPNGGPGVSRERGRENSSVRLRFPCVYPVITLVLLFVFRKMGT